MRFHIFWFGCLLAVSTAQRQSRQLDLGPSPISNTVQQSSFQQPGYLPPIEPAGARNDPVVLAPTTPKTGPTHHGRNLCTDPFHSFLCADLKPRRPITGAIPVGNGLSGASTFLEPSKVLAPPINDLEEIVSTTTHRPTTTTPRATTTTRRPTTTTTRRPTTTTTTRRPTTTTERPIAPAPSNDVRTYLPPEVIAPAAAQQDVTIIKPEPEHHHHHPHHDGRDLCTDPFHSFLCAPLKPRKRITGDRPNGIPAASNDFIKKVKPDLEIAPQPSNEIPRAYLPPTTRQPSTIRFRVEPSNEIPRAYLPPSTTPKRIQPQPSNAITRAYLPPTTTTTTQRIEPQQSNEIPRAYLPPIAPQPSNIDNNYLPPIEPAAAQNSPAIAAPDHHHGSHGFKDICSDPFHSFLCTVPKQRTRITGALPDKFRNINPAPSNIDETREKIPAASETKSFVGYNYPKPERKLPLPSEPKPQIISTTAGYSYPKPENKLVLPSENQLTFISTTQKPTTGYSYPKPEIKLTFPPPKFVPTTGYSYPKPDNKLFLPSEIQQNIISTTRKPTTGYSYPKPINKLNLPSENQPKFISTTAKPTTGYSYPKPDNKLTLPTETKPTVTGYSYPKPQQPLSLPTETKPVDGYDYPRPKSSFPEPAAKSTDYPQSSNKLTIPSARPKNALPSSLKEARERLQSTKVANIPNISNQNSVSDLIPVNQVQFPAEGDLGIRFGDRLKRRERKTRLIQPANSYKLQ